jgi:hypothetical protein
MLLTPGLLRSRLSSIGRTEVEIFLGRNAILLMLYLTSIPLSRLYVLPIHGTNAVEKGL